MGRKKFPSVRCDYIGIARNLGSSFARIEPRRSVVQTGRILRDAVRKDHREGRVVRPGAKTKTPGQFGPVHARVAPVSIGKGAGGFKTTQQRGETNVPSVGPLPVVRPSQPVAHLPRGNGDSTVRVDPGAGADVRAIHAGHRQKNKTLPVLSSYSFKLYCRNSSLDIRRNSSLDIRRPRSTRAMLICFILFTHGHGWGNYFLGRWLNEYYHTTYSHPTRPRKIRQRQYWVRSKI